MKEKLKICPWCNQECDLKEPAKIIVCKDNLWHGSCYKIYWNHSGEVGEPVWNSIQECWSIADLQEKKSEEPKNTYGKS